MATMQLLGVLFLLTWLGLNQFVEAYTPAPTYGTDALAAVAKINQEIYKAGSGSKCTPKNAYVRKEWSALSLDQRMAYTDAVLCLMTRPPKSDPSQVPGARSRFDDFVGVHIQQTLTIHQTAQFLAWHRYYTWAYEQALRNECGYTGYQPYWNWGKSAFDPINSPVFDGSAGSMSGNGVFEAHDPICIFPGCVNPIPPGQGGGCVETGPFKNMTVNLGPVVAVLNVPEVKPNGNGLGYNPRCLRRDISPEVSRNWTKESDSFILITTNRTLLDFQNNMQGQLGPSIYGVHTGGHLTFLGDPAGELFSSPGDPNFYLHHGQIDRTWWIWQNQNPWGRTRQVAGTITLLNMPPSRNGTLDDIMTFGGVDVPDIKIGDAVDTMDGPFCYRYE